MLKYEREQEGEIEKMVYQARRSVNPGTSPRFRVPTGKIGGKISSFDVTRGFGWIAVDRDVSLQNGALRVGELLKVRMEAVYGADMFPPDEGALVAFKVGGTANEPIAVDLEPLRA